MPLEQLYKRLEEIYPEMVKIRRHLHENPELSFQEVETPKFIARYLTDLGIEVKTGVGGRGVIGYLKGAKAGKTIALRADFDALPIDDQKKVAYKSKVPGVMHACGHDGHTTVLLAVAKILASYKEQLEGTVVFIHQFAEEVFPGGAKLMIEDGCLDGVDAIFGMHLISTLPVGELHYCKGYSMAASDMFTIKVFGKGGHGAMPDETIDPITTGSQIVQNLQHIISRNVSPLYPAVLSIGNFVAEGGFNIIPEEAIIQGTVRTFQPEVRDLIEKRIKEIATYVCKANGATCKVDYDRGYDANWNHPDETLFIRDMGIQALGGESVVEMDQEMGGEDFAYYLQHVPGSYFNIGARITDDTLVFPHHHPNFDFNEEAMLAAAKVFIAAVVHSGRMGEYQNIT